MNGINNIMNSGASAESKGVVFFAHNTADVDYVRIADISARLVEQHLNLPITLITDTQSNPKYNYDHVVRVEYRGNNFRNDHISKETKQWKNHGRYTAYEHSPYDNTLLIDTDYLVLDNSLLKLMELDYDYRIMEHSNSSAETMPTRMGIVGLPYLWATVVMFRKCPRSEMFFNLIGRIQRNWAYYRNLFMVDGTSYRNDYAFAMSNTIINGYSLTTKNIIPWKMFTVVQEVVRMDTNLKDKIIVRLKDLAITIPKHNVHIMDKDFLTSDNFEEFVEEVLDVST
jgi:hypothetical protein